MRSPPSPSHRRPPDCYLPNGCKLDGLESMGDSQCNFRMLHLRQAWGTWDLWIPCLGGKRSGLQQCDIVSRLLFKTQGGRGYSPGGGEYSQGLGPQGVQVTQNTGVKKSSAKKGTINIFPGLRLDPTVGHQIIRAVGQKQIVWAVIAFGHNHSMSAVEMCSQMLVGKKLNARWLWRNVRDKKALKFVRFWYYLILFKDIKFVPGRYFMKSRLRLLTFYLTTIFECKTSLWC